MSALALLGWERAEGWGSRVPLGLKGGRFCPSGGLAFAGKLKCAEALWVLPLHCDTEPLDELHQNYGS